MSVYAARLLGQAQQLQDTGALLILDGRICFARGLNTEKRCNDEDPIRDEESRMMDDPVREHRTCLREKQQPGSEHRQSQYEVVARRQVGTGERERAEV